MIIRKGESIPDLNLPEEITLEVNRQSESANSIINQIFTQHGIDLNAEYFGFEIKNSDERIYISGDGKLAQFKRIRYLFIVLEIPLKIRYGGRLCTCICLLHA